MRQNWKEGTAVWRQSALWWECVCVCVCSVRAALPSSQWSHPLTPHVICDMFLRAGRESTKRLCLESRKLWFLQFLVLGRLRGSMDSGITHRPVVAVLSTFGPVCSLRSDFAHWVLRGLNFTFWCHTKKVETCQKLPPETTTFLSSWGTFPRLGESPSSPAQATFLPDLCWLYAQPPLISKALIWKEGLFWCFLGDGEEDEF